MFTITEIQKEDRDSVSIMPDVVFNLFSIRFSYYRLVEVCMNGECYYAPVAIERDLAHVGVCLMPIPNDVFAALVEWVFHSYMQVRRISLIYSYCNYKDQLEPISVWHIDLPNSVDALYERLSSKGRYNLSRERKQLSELGNCEYRHFSRNEIPLEIVAWYFQKKKKEFGTDYHLDCDAYLTDYYISDAYTLTLNEEIISVLFSCEQGECVYLENLAFDPRFSKQSVGFQLYVYFLEQMVLKLKQAVLLGGGDYMYKKRFGSALDTVYKGVVYRNLFWKKLYELAIKCQSLVKG
jgi:hypothetical protein